MDPTTGQHFKNLFEFIPRGQVVLDTLHLLLRCVDRLVHTLALLYLQVTAPSQSDPNKQLLAVNKGLAPYIAKITKKVRITFQPPGDRGSLWKLSRVSGTMYRVLLKEFKYAVALPDAPPAEMAQHQAAWDDFRDIFNTINSAAIVTSHYRIDAKITTWFKAFTNDYVEHLKAEAAARAAAEEKKAASDADTMVPSKAKVQELKDWLTLRALMPADEKDRRRLKADWVALVSEAQAAEGKDSEEEDVTMVPSKAKVQELKDWLKARSLFPTEKANEPKNKAGWVALVTEEQAKEQEAARGVYEFYDDEESELGNNPTFLASFLFTPYYHSLLNHIPKMIVKAGNLRSFSGQNFEKMNNDHRLYWQNSCRIQGKEIPSIIDQHLRVRMNPVRRRDIATDLIQCPHCSHPPFSINSKLPFKKHVKTQHPEVTYDAAFIQDLLAANAHTRSLIGAATEGFAREVTDVAFEALRVQKSKSNAAYHAKEKITGVRKKTREEWATFTAVAPDP